MRIPIITALWGKNWTYASKKKAFLAKLDNASDWGLRGLLCGALIHDGEFKPVGRDMEDVRNRWKNAFLVEFNKALSFTYLYGWIPCRYDYFSEVKDYPCKSFVEDKLCERALDKLFTDQREISYLISKLGRSDIRTARLQAKLNMLMQKEDQGS